MSRTIRNVLAVQRQRWLALRDLAVPAFAEDGGDPSGDHHEPTFPGSAAMTIADLVRYRSHSVPIANEGRAPTQRRPGDRPSCARESGEAGHRRLFRAGSRFAGRDRDQGTGGSGQVHGALEHHFPERRGRGSAAVWGWRDQPIETTRVDIFLRPGGRPPAGPPGDVRRRGGHTAPTVAGRRGGPDGESGWRSGGLRRPGRGRARHAASRLG